MNIIKLMIPKLKVVYIKQDATLYEALEKMKENRYSIIPVLSLDGKFAGTLSEGDCLWYILGNNAYSESEMMKIRVKDVMSTCRNRAVKIDASVDDLYSRIEESNFAPVTDDRGCFIGIVTRSAVLNFMRTEGYLAGKNTADPVRAAH